MSARIGVVARTGEALADKVRSAAQEAWGAESAHADVVVTAERPIRVDGGYWVQARLWVPDEWVNT